MDKQNPTAGSAEKAVADIYSNALDQQTRNKVGLGSLAGYLESVKKADTIPAYLQAVASIHKELGKNSLFVMSAMPDPKNSKKYSLGIEEPFLPVSKENLEDENSIQEVKQYVIELLKANGLKDKQAKEQSDKLLGMYKDIAKVALTKKEKANVKLTMNTLTPKELQDKLPSMDGQKFLKDSARDGYEHIVFQNAKTIDLINRYLSKDKLELLKTYTIIALLNEYAPYLPKPYADAYAKFNRMEGLEQKDQAWEVVKNMAAMEVGEIYAKKYFNANKKAVAEKLINDILEAYKKICLHWIG